jgi:predicted RNA binding protein YcfA (HicA-like mRNA interferase family)
MTQRQKLISKILTGTSDPNIVFDELCGLLEWMGFEKRIKGSHHIFYKTGVEEIINIQPNGSKAKAYQVKQVREIIVKYKLSDL